MPEAKQSKKIAIVTGASAGLGAEFARQIEAGYFLDEIWLVARRPEPMKEVAEKFCKSKGVILALDLASPAGLAVLEKKLQDESPEVVFLVNNAGYGKIGPFAELGLHEQLGMVELNVFSLTYLTRAALPYMRPGSSILQVASSIGFVPAPNFAVYAATKAYVVSLSEALHQELMAHGIRVIAVCPGPVATEFLGVAQKNDFLKDKIPEAEPLNKSLVASAESVVAKALADLARNRRHSVYGNAIRLFVFLAPKLPRGLLLRLIARRI